METSGGAAQPLSNVSLAQQPTVSDATRCVGEVQRRGVHRPGARCRRRAGRGLLSGPSLPAR